MSVLPEQQALAAVAARRAAGIEDLGRELRRRMDELGSLALDSPQRRDAFAEVLDAFTVPGVELLVVEQETHVDAAEHVIYVEGLLVEHRTLVARIVRTIDMGTLTVEHAYLQIEAAHRGRAIAPQLMLSGLELYDRLGLRQITVHAGLQSGRFYWAGRMGFAFTDEIQRRQVERWATFVLGALGVEHDLRGLDEPLRWALLGTEVDPPVEVTFEQLRDALPARIAAELLDPHHGGVVGYLPASKTDAGDCMVDTVRHLELIRDGNGLADDEPVSLGKALMLTGPDWYGTFDLADTVRRTEYEREARARVAAAS